MIDTHCHLTDSRLLDQIDAVLERAKRARVNRIVTIACEPADWVDAVALAAKYENVYCAVGMHPCYLPNNGTPRSDTPTPSREEVDQLLSAHLQKPRVVAIGEIGLDRHWDKSEPTFKLQVKYFESQLQLATDLDKPVVLHTREAVDEGLDILASFPKVRAVFHSFTGTPQQAKRITDNGYLIGFTGPVTYKKNDDLRKAARECPIDQLLIETDGPYLSPEPVRAQRINEPAFVAHIAACISREKGVSVEAFDEATTRNAREFFGF
jgi:TatD DNase family protein